MLIALVAGTAALAETAIVVPGAPAPLLPPPPPPPVAAPQPPNSPAKLDTFGDRVNRCAHFGALQALGGGARDAYVRACANNR
jgi:hypothetical protein